jgi:AcrR family transcriptional regulator
MRITAEEKEATRRRILDAAIESFRKHGFEATTTRDIATAADIATGTLFNYFATKEAIVEFLAAQALGRAKSHLKKERSPDDLAEALFAYIAAELRQLKPLRKFIAPVLATAFSPFAATRQSDSNNAIRAEHIETVEELAHQHGIPELSPVALQVYWTLYIGVLSFWAADKSPKQEDTLALVDQSLTMFVSWLRTEQKKTSK